MMHVMSVPSARRTWCNQRNEKTVRAGSDVTSSKYRRYRHRYLLNLLWHCSLPYNWAHTSPCNEKKTFVVQLLIFLPSSLLQDELESRYFEFEPWYRITRYQSFKRTSIGDLSTIFSSITGCSVWHEGDVALSCTVHG